MDEQKVNRLLEDIRMGRTTVEDGVASLRHLPYDDIGFAKLDTHRSLRCGFPEVIYCPGKTEKQILSIVKKRISDSCPIVLTKVGPETAAALSGVKAKVEHFEDARLIVVNRPKKKLTGLVAVVSAGTTDIPIAEEAAVVAEVMGSFVERIYDVGVAGVHRVLSFKDTLSKAKTIVAVAGMDGVLPSLLGGLVSCPVVAVPTSVGYGASFGGLSALLTMLNSCAPGVTVVNIDNGFGAGYIAGMINRASSDKKVAADL